MIVPDKWWNGCSTFEPNEGVIIGFDPNATKERYFLLQLDSESNPARHSSGPYQMRYDAVYKYADTYDEDYSTYDRHISDAGVGNIQGMGYGVFCNWMNGKKRGSKRINARAMKSVEHFVNHWEGEKKN